jgi:hypothetical protein
MLLPSAVSCSKTSDFHPPYETTLTKCPSWTLCACGSVQHGAVVAVVECVASNEAVWRQQLEARAAQQLGPQDHKPQTWQDLQQLLQRCVYL